MGIALKSLSHVKSITILERHQSNELQDQGAGIRVGDEVAEFFQRYANTSMQQYGIPFDALNVLNTKGEVVSRREYSIGCATTWFQLYRVLMLAFADKTAQEAAVCTYRYNYNVQKMVERDEKVEVLLTDEAGKEQTLTADLVIGADGASSKVREIFLPETKRSYVGYVMLRGLVPVEELSSETRKVMEASATFLFTHNSQVISYTVPGNKTGPPDSHNKLNWGWYMNKTEEELGELMTDATGKKHYYALPQGAMQASFAEDIRAKAQQELAPQMAETVAKTESPYVQVITDSRAPHNVFWGGKVLLVGDAAGGQRPHSASAVTQTCIHAHLLQLYLEGQMSLEDWRQDTQIVSSTLVATGQELGVICLSETIDPSEKAKQCLGKLLSCHEVLMEKWKPYSVGNGVKV